ncbi:hypothetical protein RAS1_12200 [Phycisphaerae bacterium RAS1]|nr:hypothetical protein RAS1_12200 [Phycisphaerae bacterium RAS1]
MALNLKSYEGQARASVGLAIAGALFAVCGAYFIVSAFDRDLFAVVYDPKSKRLPAIGGCLLLSLAAGAAGFFLGLNGAGQKRNKQPQLSWTGFFLNAAVLTLALSAGVFFYFTKYAMMPKAT